MRNSILAGLLLALIFLNLVGCSEVPRATPGFQSIAVQGKPEANPTPQIVPVGDPRRRAYEASLQGRVCYYARVIDQDGKPVPQAMILVLLERLGWGNSTYFKCRTYTDDDGRFSVVGGVGSHVRISIYKAGYTPDGRRGALKGDAELLQATPDAPATITLWKNTGFDRSRLILHRPADEQLRFQYSPPLPARIRFDLVRGIIAKEGEDWDIELKYAINDRGIVDNPESYYTDSRYMESCHISVNQGTMSYLDDPLPGFARPTSGFTYDNCPGVVVRGLKAGTLPYLLRTEIHMFQFQSRGGKVHGIWSIPNGRPASNGSLAIDMHGAINPTGSPALFEIEPTEKDLSTDGYPLSE